MRDPRRFALYAPWTAGFVFATLLGCSTSEIRTLSLESPPGEVGVESYRELQTLFQALGYDWETLHQGVPRIVLRHLPQDLHRIRDSQERKRLFFLSILPSVLMADREVVQRRAYLIALLRQWDRGEPLAPEALQWLETLVREYRLSGDPLENPQVRQELLRRVDRIPLSLVLAQAAIESGWGTSRFARLANNLFGVHAHPSVDGLAPEGVTRVQFVLRRYPSVYHAIRAYIHNLNTHPAYREFRALRAALREQGRPLSGLALARGLVRYSERRWAYVRGIRRMILQNHLEDLGPLVLRTQGPGINPHSGPEWPHS